MAVAFSRHWTDRELGHGTRKGKMYFDERVPGGLNLLAGPGHIYLVLDPSPFKRLNRKGEIGTPVGGAWEFVSKEPAAITHLTEIPNVLAAVVALGAQITPFHKTARPSSWRR